MSPDGKELIADPDAKLEVGRPSVCMLICMYVWICMYVYMCVRLYGSVLVYAGSIVFIYF